MKKLKENPENYPVEPAIDLRNPEEIKSKFERQQMRDIKKAGIVDCAEIDPKNPMPGYVCLNDRFRMRSDNPNLTSLIQYATYYFLRLSILKEKVVKQAKDKWYFEEDLLSYVKDILDIKCGVKTVIVGTLFKDQVKKPCILKHLDGVLGTRKPRNYCSENDQIILDDSSGRIRVKPMENFRPGDVITGSVVALKGEADRNGIFIVEDFVYAGYNQSDQMSIPKSLTLFQPKRDLLDPVLLDSERKFVAFVSGFEIGLEQD